MTQMTERELAALVDEAEANDISNSGSYGADNERYLSYYQGEAFGDEVIPGRSSVVSTEVRDLVESDMPSFARVFLGAGDPVEFRATTTNPESIQEAKDKQALVSYMIKTAPDSFRTQHDWLKSSEFQTIAMLEYGIEEIKTPKVKRYSGLTEDELAAQMLEFEDDDDVDSVTIVEQDDTDDDGTFSVLIRITHKKNQFFMRNIPSEDQVISRNAWNKNDADIVGKRFKKSRSQLIAEGFDRELIDSLPTNTRNDKNQNGTEQQRYNRQGGAASQSDISNKASDEIEGLDVYINVDWDDDGIAERRHVIKVGKEILVNEAFDHIPFAITSSMLMPNNINGLPRAELAMVYQRVGSTLWRQTLDNFYAVNNPRTVYTDAIDVDDLLDISLNGIIHSEDSPANSVMPLVTPYIGDKALQVTAYMDSKRAQSTGSLQVNQALQGDQLNDETATRFEGMQDAAAAKIELVARVIAETGYRDVYEGAAWFANHFQDQELEIFILGRPMIVNPSTWKFDHHINAVVGTGAGDDEKTMANLSAIYQAQTSLIQQGSKLADEQKRYNTLAQMVKTTGRDSVQDFFNNPEQPIEMVTAERDMMRAQIEQMSAAQQNPLAEAEQVKAQGAMEREQIKQKFQGQIKQMEMQAANQEELFKMQLKHRDDTDNLKFNYDELKTQTDLKYTELELKYATDIKGEGQGE